MSGDDEGLPLQRLNALLARAPDSLVPALEYPAVADTLPVMDSLAALAYRGRPALAAAQARVTAADRAIDAARKDARREWRENSRRRIDGFLLAGLEPAG